MIFVNPNEILSVKFFVLTLYDITGLSFLYIYKQLFAHPLQNHNMQQIESL